MREPIPRSDLEYVRLAVTTLLLVLALPFVLAHFWLNPEKSAEHAIKGATGR